MARLTIEQIKAPDLSVASQATARAGETFQRGMSSASDLLSKYQEGLTAQGDAELTNLLAGAKNEDEWNSILASTDFSKMNLSEGMRANIINRRDNVLGYEQDRATRRGTDATTAGTQANTARTYNTIGLENNRDARAGDIHGVVMGDHAWRQGARQEDANMAGLALSAAEENMTNGRQASGGDVSGLTNENTSGLLGQGAPAGTNVGPRADGSGIAFPQGQYAAPVGNVMNQEFQRSMGVDAETADVLSRAFLMNFQDESGIQADTVEGVPNVHGTRGKGYYQLTGPRRDAFEAQFGADGYTDANQVAFLIQELGGSESRAGKRILEAAASGDVGATAASIVTDFLRPAAKQRDRRVAQYTGGGGNQNPSARARATQNPNQGAGPASQAYDRALANSKFQSTEEVLGAYERQYDYAETGEAAISAADTKLAEEALAQSILDIAETNVDPTEAVVQFRNENPGATAVERLATEAKILEATGDGGALSAARLQIGTTGARPADISTADATINVIQEKLKRDPFNVALMGSEEYEDNPAGMMTSALDGLGISTKPSDVESAINTLMSDEGVTRAQAAYSYARAAESESRLGRILSIGGDNLSNSAAAKFARENFKDDRTQEARTTVADARRVVEQVQMATTNLGRLEQKIQKLRQSDAIVPPELTSQRDDARRALNQMWENYGNGEGEDLPAPQSAADLLSSVAGGNGSPGMRDANPQAGWNSYMYQ
jgi:hypothetical protein